MRITDISNLNNAEYYGSESYTGRAKFFLERAVIKSLIPYSMIGSGYPIFTSVFGKIFELKFIDVSGRSVFEDN